MPPISLTNNANLIKDLSQLGSGQYMLKTDANGNNPTLVKASLGHKIRQFLGFESAKTENQQTIDAIKMALGGETSEIAKAFSEGLDKANALSGTSIKSAFSVSVVKTDLNAALRSINTIYANECAKPYSPLSLITGGMFCSAALRDKFSNAMYGLVKSTCRNILEVYMKEVGGKGKQLKNEDLANFIKNGIQIALSQVQHKLGLNIRNLENSPFLKLSMAEQEQKVKDLIEVMNKSIKDLKWSDEKKTTFGEEMLDIMKTRMTYGRSSIVDNESINKNIDNNINKNVAQKHVVADLSQAKKVNVLDENVTIRSDKVLNFDDDE